MNMPQDEIYEEDEIEDEVDESEEQENEQSGKKTEDKIKLDWEMDPIERLRIEIENSENQNQKKIGEYLIEQFNKDVVLKNCYKERKITLNAIGDYVMDCAKKALGNGGGWLDDLVVYGWVLHFVQDEPVTIAAAKEDSYELTKLDKEKAKKNAIAKFEAEEIEKLRKAQEKKEAAQKRKIDKEIEKEKASGQMNLFGDF